jgi:hypothetical protein
VWPVAHVTVHVRTNTRDQFSPRDAQVQTECAAEIGRPFPRPTCEFAQVQAVFHRLDQATPAAHTYAVVPQVNGPTASEEAT